MTITVIEESSTAVGSSVSGTSVCGGSPPYYSNVTEKQKIGRRNSEYAAITRDGGMHPSLDYFVSKEFRRYTIGRQPSPNGDKYYHATPCGIDFHYDSFTNDEIIEARSIALEKVYDKLQSKDQFNLGTSLVEMGRTVGMVAQTATRITNTFRRLRKGDINGAFRALALTDDRLLRGQRWKNVGAHRRDLLRRTRRSRGNQALDFAASSWLELQYGWRPLLSDVYDSATLAGSGLQKRGDDVLITSQHTITKRNSSSIVNEFQKVRSVDSGNHQFVVSYNVKLKVISPKMRALSSLGLTNPLNLAWEIIPFSFVVDWFVPVQGYLENLDALTGYTVTDSSSFEQTDSVSNRRKSSTATPKQFSPYAVEIETEKGQRFAGVGLPPLRPPNLSSLSTALGGKRLANAAALLRSVFGR